MGGPFIENFGYKACFLASGSMVILAGVAVQFLVHEDLGELKTKSGKEKNYIRL